MSIDASKIQEIIAIVNKVIPGWTGFSDPRFEEEEVNYKKEAMVKARDLINKDELDRLIFADKNFEEVISRFEKVGRSTNLLFQGVPLAGDLNILYRESLDKPVYCQKIYNLLYGDESSSERLRLYVDYVQANNLPNKWTFPTYMLYMCFPQSEMFVKPTAMKRFLELMGRADIWSHAPTPEAYSSILQLATELKIALDEYGPRDMVDIQGLIWIVSGAGTKRVLSKAKKDEFSKLFEEFTKSYVPSVKGQEHASIYAIVREQGQQNYQDILQQAERGVDVTVAVLLKLLPYHNTKGNKGRGAWIHVAPSITKDLKDWYQKAGRTHVEDWPKIAQAILEFIQRCLADPSQLTYACTKFSDLDYTKGFQTGMLTPILNALSPDDYVLINNKSRKVVNYFAGTSYDQPLKFYPEVNASAQSLITEASDVIKKSGLPNVLDGDLFDMFSHWLVAEKKYFQPEVINLALPFSEMFTNREEAEWAFDLLKETAERLGITGAEDPLAAFTLRKSAGDILIRLNYCHWLVHGFAGRSKSLKSMTIAVPQEIVDLPTLYKGVFTQTEGKPDVFLYTLPINSVRPFEGSLRVNFDETLDYIAEKFKGWEKSPYHDRANPKIAEAIFDLDKRSQLFRDGISSDEINEEVQYWKIAPERNGRLWPKWCDEGYVSIGWDELGDLSGISREDFEIRRDSAMQIHNDWTEDGCEQVWKFANMHVGDRIVANRGTTQVLGIGTVTGAYYFVPEVEHGHRFPVKWDDITLREINEPGWRRSIVSLDKEKFDRILNLPAASIKVNPEYSQSQCAEETGFTISKIRSWIKAIERKGQAILYGPPGTGKTYNAERLGKHLIGGGDGFIETVQFHPAYAYEDFIQGIRPKTRPDGGLEYPMLSGRFLKFCDRASEKSGICVLIIDEINRANLSRVFGELMYLLEYRDKSINLAGGELFQIPSNVRIIGTMNTADRSIALVDHALRRRFAFLELYPDMEVLRHYHESTGFDIEGLISVLERLNQRIENPHYAVGISYFLRSDMAEQIEDIWTMEIEPYLNEYFFDHLDWAREFSWIKIKPTILP